ncbi:MAG: hypothetical protein J5U17_03900 [Candidatus Methanoperedens sp.]|nr:hypothetical protein [Candidatus Methanoperedens sp.]MCE8424904.1 hypothetical protein [Candidatus Methanoperedens sp.]MCE8428112.1 hypothetical protein [Candidatus Methanoperedens sp.]
MDTSDLESTHKFFDMWMKNYEANVCRISEIPAIGPTREKSEKMMKGFPVFLNLYSTWMDTMADFQGISIQAMKRMNEKALKMKSGEVQDTPKELYNIWIESYSETFKEFLRSGHFASDMGKFMSSFLDAQKYNREMLEEHYLKPSNLPTKTDIDELNKELYSLRKQVRELAGRMNEFSMEK